MLFLTLGVYQNIIYEHDDKSVQKGLEQLSHEVYKYNYRLVNPKDITKIS